MIDLDDIELYLPKYLSRESQKDLFKELGQFPENLDSRLFTKKLLEEKNIFQGDGLADLLMVNLPNPEVKRSKGMVISNTCDINPENERMFSSRICYSPIIDLQKYKHLLLSKNIYDEEKIDSHVSSIKQQRITQIFYIPEVEDNPESIIFFDMIVNCDNKVIERETIKDRRVFTLSDYGLYLFLFKMSVHFTRVQEGLDRGAA